MLIFHRLLGSDDENATSEERAERLLFYSSNSSSPTSESKDILMSTREGSKKGGTSGDTVIRTAIMRSVDDTRINNSKSEYSTEDDEEKEMNDAEYNRMKETTEKYIKRVMKEAGLNNLLNVKKEIPIDSYGEKELSLLHMLESLLHFSKKFCRNKVEIILTEKFFWCFYECEENVIMCAAVKMVEKNGIKKSEMNRHEIMTMLKKFYQIFVFQHGTFNSILYATKKKRKVSFSENNCNVVNENISVKIDYSTSSTDDDENNKNGNSSIQNIVQRIPFKDFGDAKPFQINHGEDLKNGLTDITSEVGHRLDVNTKLNNAAYVAHLSHDNIQPDGQHCVELIVDNLLGINVDIDDDEENDDAKHIISEKHIEEIKKNSYDYENKDLKKSVDNISNCNKCSTDKSNNMINKDLNECDNSNEFSRTVIYSKPDSQTILQLKLKISSFVKKADYQISHFSRSKGGDNVDNDFIENYVELRNNDVLNNSQEIPDSFLDTDKKESFSDDFIQTNNVRTSKIYTLMQKKEIHDDFQLSKMKKIRNFTLQKIFQYFK